MIREYLDCCVWYCDACEGEIDCTAEIEPEERTRRHYCDEHRPGCDYCGADLSNATRHDAPDITPDGQPMRCRCRACHKRADTIPAPPPDTLRSIELEEFEVVL